MNAVEAVFLVVGFTILQAIGASLPVLANAPPSVMIAFYIAWMFFVGALIHLATGNESQYAISSSNLPDPNKAESVSFTIYIILLSLVPNVLIIGKKYGFPYDLIAGLLGVGISYIPKITN